MKYIIMALLLLPWTPCFANGQVDGYYVGSRTVIRGGGRDCPANGDASWQITNGRLAYRFWAGSVPAQVSPDGTLKGEMLYAPPHGTHWWARVNGTIANGSLEADAEWRACQLHFSLKRA
jgi:hypothetical protein